MYIYRMVYRTFATGVTYWVCKDLDFFPPMLGGSGDLYKWYEGMPAWNKPEYFDLIFITSVGFFLEDFIELLVREKNKDFIEMVLHHFVTIVLIYFSHILNCG